MKLVDAIKEMESRVEKLRYTVPLAFVEVARPNTPIDTGVLRNSWTWMYLPSDIQSVVNDAPYAAYVEFGTDKMAPRRYTQMTLRQIDTILKRAGIMALGSTSLTTSNAANMTNRSVPWW